jgi:hypothetical protein
LHVIERFTLGDEGRSLRRTFVATDPLYFEGEYKGADTVYVADVPYQPIACDDLSYKSDEATPGRPWVSPISLAAIALVAGIALVVWRVRTRA